jgi:hypothetical protein
MARDLALAIVDRAQELHLKDEQEKRAQFRAELSDRCFRIEITTYPKDYARMVIIRSITVAFHGDDIYWISRFPSMVKVTDDLTLIWDLDKGSMIDREMVDRYHVFVYNCIIKKTCVKEGDIVRSFAVDLDTPVSDIIRKMIELAKRIVKLPDA